MSIQTKIWKLTLAYSLVLFSTMASAATTTIQGGQVGCGGLQGGIWDGDKCILNADLVIASGDSVVVAYPHILYIKSGKTLTINLGASLINQGQIENYGALVNNGTLTNSNAELHHHFPSAAYSGNLLNSGDLYFSGTLPEGDTDVGVFSTGIVAQVKLGDTLTIANETSLTIPSGSRFVNDGTLIVNHGGTVNNNHRFENNDTVQNAGDIISTNALTNSVDAQLKISSTATLQINAGTLINLGTIENQGTFQNDATINNGFTIGNSNDNAQNTLIDNQGSLNNYGTIHNGNDNGSGRIETVGAINNYSTINNQGGSIIINQQSRTKRGSLTLDNASTVNNGGTLTLNAGGSVELKSGSTINNYLTFEVFSNLNINSGAEITNHSDATLTTSDGAGRIQNNGGIINNNDSSTMTLALNTKILNNGSIFNNASFTSRGTIENEGGGLFENNNYFYNIGLLTNFSTITNNGDFGSTTAFQNNNNGHINNYGGVITNNSTGTFTLNTFHNYAQFINYGTLSLQRDIIQYNGSELALLAGEASNYGLFENKTGATISFTEGLFTNIGSLDNNGAISDSTTSSMAFTNNGELTNWACDGGVLDAQVSGTDAINNCKLVAIYRSNATNNDCDGIGTWNAAKSRCEGTMFRINGTTCGHMNGQWNNTTKNCSVDSFLSEANLLVNIPGGNTLTINGTATIEGPFFGPGKLVNYGTINTDGPMTVTGSIPWENNGTFNNNGVMEVWGPASFNNVGNLNNLSTGEVELMTDGVFNNTGNFTNEGLLSLDGINIADNMTEISLGVFEIIVTDSLQSTIARFNNNSYGKFLNETTGQIIVRDDGIFFNKGNSDFENYGVLRILDEVENKELYFSIDDLISEEADDESSYDGYRDPSRIATFINTGEFTQYSGGSLTNYDQILIATDGLLTLEGGRFTNHGVFKIYKEATFWTRANAVIINETNAKIESFGNFFSESTIDNLGDVFVDTGGFFENLFSFSFHNKPGGIFTNAGTVRNTGGFFDNQADSVFINLKGIFENGDGSLKNELGATVVNTGTIDVGTGSFDNDGVTNNFNGASILGAIIGKPAQQIDNAPPISGDQEIKLQINTIVEIFPSATDEEGQALTYSFVGNPINGRLMSGQGRYFYAPNLGFVGEDSLYFIASDGLTSSNVGEINITVSSNNAPFMSHAAISGGALNIAADSVVNGDLAAQAAIVIGANSTVQNLYAVAAVTAGAYSQVKDIYAGAAAGLGANADAKNIFAGAAVTVGAGGSAENFYAGAAITLGAGATLSDPSNDGGDVYAGAAITGDVGTANYRPYVYPDEIAEAQESFNMSTALSAIEDLQYLLFTRDGDVLLSTSMGSATIPTDLAPGVYEGSALNMPAGSVINFTTNAPNQVWIINLSAALTLGAGTTFNITGSDTNSAAIIWNIGAALNLGAGTSFRGTAFVGGAVTGATSSVSCGHLYATGVISIGSIGVDREGDAVTCENSGAVFTYLDTLH